MYRLLSYRVMAPQSSAAARLSVVQRHLSLQPCSSKSPAAVTSCSIGSKYTPDYKNYAKIDGKLVSWMHDIPLDLDSTTREANMVVEVPRWSNGKFEIDVKAPGNPIVQDQKKGKMRFVGNLFPYKGYIHNYGAFPQTWEDPGTKCEKTGLLGDNDPLDVCEIGSKILSTGSVVRVKILGSIALIDDGELDWKVLAINVADPLAQKLNDIDDIRKYCPGLLDSTRWWFRNYKLPDGKPENTFAFNGDFLGAAATVEVVQSCSHHWKTLIQSQGKEGYPTTNNSTLKGTPGHGDFEQKQLLSYEAKPDAPIPPEVDEVFYRV
ncbi:inorganic pyrophosphatase, mitochondrial [Diutina rugosa]